MSFEARVYGKWILAGEHAVLRGSPALVFPLKSRFLEISYQAGSELLKVDLQDSQGDDLKSLFWKVVDRACLLKGLKRGQITGALKLKNNIPIGAGLGASAALCVGLARWFQHLKHVNETEIYEFSRSLEDLFHGESSGVDIAVALSGAGIQFSRLGERTAVEMKWKPNWYLSYSGQRGVTSTCVQKVKALIESDPELGHKIDLDMREAVSMARSALATNFSDGVLELKKSMDLANSCFERWDLSSDASVAAHLRMLKSHGALSVKPTGSGGGGFVLSLWKETPPEELSNELIACL